MNLAKSFRAIAALIIVLCLGFALGSGATASASGLTKSAVKKIAAKVVAKKAPSLSVASADVAKSADTASSATTAQTAASATTARTAASATTAQTAATAQSVANGSITSSSLKGGGLTSGSLGLYTARVASDGTLLGSSPGVTVTTPADVVGSYAVKFPRDVSSCTYEVTPTSFHFVAQAQPYGGDGHGVYVALENDSNTYTNQAGFDIIVVC